MKNILFNVTWAALTFAATACSTHTQPSEPHPDTAHLLESGHSPGSAVPPGNLDRD